MTRPADNAVSVIIPSYNSGHFLAEAIESLLSQGAQPEEILVVDDGSTDDTGALVRGLGTSRIHYVYQENQGPAAARNRGLKLATHDIIGFLDADDLWSPGQLNHQLLCFADRPDLEIVKGLTQVLEQTENDAETRQFKPVGKPLLFANLGGTLYRRSVFERVGLLDPALRFSEDVDWLLRARELGVSTQVINQVTQYHRRHGANITANRSPQELNMLHVMKMAIDRKRKAAQSHDH